MRLRWQRPVDHERIVRETALTLGDAIDLTSSLVAIADSARRALRSDSAGCCVLSDDQVVHAVYTTDSDTRVRDLIDGIAGTGCEGIPLLERILTSDDPLVIVPDATAEVDLWGPGGAGLGHGTVIGVRLENGSGETHKVLGMLLASYRGNHKLSRSDRAAALSLANLAALALASSRRHAEALMALASAEIAAETDPLTGILNRRGVDDRLDIALRTAADRIRTVSVLTLDLDNFKALNARGGHEAGDAALKRVARLLEGERRSGDVVGRLGGAEFVAILPDTGTEGAWLVAERLRGALAALDIAEGVGVTASIGIATFPEHGRTSGDLLRAADSAMYQAKSLGRNRSVTFNPASAADRTELSRLAADGREGYLGSVLALASAVDARDASTHDHSSTVARYAAAIAAQLGLPGDSVERVRIAGLLHDVGKVGIPDSILLKPGKLTDEEWTEMRRHPEIGARIIASPGLADVREWVLRHHERPDGRGYPDGLQRSQIPIEARILSVADAYEAMTADRPYRRALSESTARSEILSGRGSQFDDDVVDAFLSHLDGDAHADRSDAGSAAPGPIVSSAA